MLIFFYKAKILYACIYFFYIGSVLEWLSYKIPYEDVEIKILFPGNKEVYELKQKISQVSALQAIEHRGHELLMTVCRYQSSSIKH